MTLFILDNFKRVCKVLEDYAFFFCFFDFYHVSRHFVLGSSVDVVYFLSSKSYCSSACVHSGISAADDSNLFAQLDFFVSYNFSQEVDTADNAFSIFALAAYACGYPCTDAQKDCVEVFLNCFKRNILANLGVGDNFNAHCLDSSDFFIENCLRKSVFRDTVSQHTACLRHCFENSYSVSHLSQEICCGKSHRAAADDGYALTCVFFTFRQESISVKVVVRCKTLKLLD